MSGGGTAAALVLPGAVREWTLPVPCEPLMSNHMRRMHWSEIARRQRAIKQAVIVMCLSRKIPNLDGRCAARLRFFPPDARRRDEDNLAPSYKAAIDGLKSRGYGGGGGVITDDSPAYLRHEWITFGPILTERTAPRMELIVAELAEPFNVPALPQQPSGR